jgi:hypothetical protein
MRTIIHLGGNKTSSTLLQRRVFNKASNVLYMGEDSDAVPDSQELLSNLFSLDSIDYLSNNAGHKLVNYEKAYSDKLTCIISSEDMISYGMQSITAKRLHECFPNAEIVLVIRNQIESLLSWYISHGSRLRNVPRNYWKKYVNASQSFDFFFDYPYFSIKKAFEYSKIVKIYAGLYGANKVKIIPYEWLKIDKLLYYNSISKAFNIDLRLVQSAYDTFQERKARSLWELRLHSITGKELESDFTKKLCAAMDKHFPIKKSEIISQRTKERICEEYRLGNRELSRIVNFDLNDLGYPT